MFGIPGKTPVTLTPAAVRQIERLMSKGDVKGLRIGVIDAIWKETGQLYLVASIRLSADLDRTEEVICVAP